MTPLSFPQFSTFWRSNQTAKSFLLKDGGDVHQWKTVQGRRRKRSQKKSDIATSTSSHNEHPDDIMTYFFTSFPDSFGALAMLRAFIKRDVGGRRFGFARFSRVTDIRGFELELDNIIIGRDKISVNLARFQRVEGERKFDSNHVRKEGRRSRKDKEQHDKEDNPGAQSIILSYEAAKEDMEKLQKAFVGVVHEPGMTYNIQSSFHRQGYFGVKVTPLGANLALLEEQGDGEVKALMEYAKGWMDQWFKEIRSWCPSDLDAERTIWLMIYGVPSHAWNESFFNQLVKPWGSFINEDECMLKKSTMDVARLMIRMSCQQIIDEFVDVNINDVVYHLRVLEDSYGSMRIMIPQKKMVTTDKIQASSRTKMKRKRLEGCGRRGTWRRENQSFTGDGFLGIYVEWKVGLLYIVNVYSSCNISGKRKLWPDLVDFKLNNEPGEWCLEGEFNSILKVGERRGSSCGAWRQGKRIEFIQFIDALEELVVPYNCTIGQTVKVKLLCKGRRGFTQRIFKDYSCPIYNGNFSNVSMSFSTHINMPKKELMTSALH
ncbi:hypothetical protein TSUD_403050 [Trifolium subterraneum]|uniref:Uncharacterized protein n=1 Tax=Trifolium subterraneum TaxID=3900 RepID=A0A2Z6NTN6_TRISU|nr:hypothetical protein TSUD_403050 [Trifolium subterraneum]